MAKKSPRDRCLEDLIGKGWIGVETRRTSYGGLKQHLADEFGLRAEFLRRLYQHTTTKEIAESPDTVWAEPGSELSIYHWYFHPSHANEAMLFKLRV